MNKLRRVLLILPLLLTTGILPATAQNRRNDNFHQGVRDGGRGGNYYNSNRDRRYDRDRYDRDRYDRDRYDRNQGGIGPGKGALIGAGGGAILGALFGGGLKGTIIGGAAGAGIGAIVGKAHQDKQRNDYYGR